MSSTPDRAERLRQRRELRAEIARRRRRIEHSIAGLKRESRRAVSWRRWVARRPLAALGVAFGVGLMIARGLPRQGWLRWLAGLAMKNAWGGLRTTLVREASVALTEAIAQLRKT